MFEQQSLGFLAKICSDFVNECYLKLWKWMTPQANKERKMLIINAQMESKESIKEAGKVRLNRKTSKARKYCQKITVKLGGVDRVAAKGRLLQAP